MRICIVTGPFQSLPPTGCGAVERRWLNIAKEFVKNGHEVKIFARKDVTESRFELCEGIEIYRSRGFKRSRNIYYDIIKDFIYSFDTLFKSFKSDITVLNCFALPILSCLNKNKMGKVVYNVARFPKGQLKYYSSVDRFSAVSTAIFEAIRDQAPQLVKKTKVIPNPLDTTVFYNSGQRKKTETNYRTIGYTGRIHPEKGIDLLIKAFRHIHRMHRNVILKIVGPISIAEGGGGSNYMAHLSNLSNELPVYFEPPIYDSQKLAECLRSFDYYCYPSLADKGESFGVAPLEAMGVGLPVVVSKLSCFNEFIEHEKNGLVFDHKLDNNVGQIVSALCRLIENDNFALGLATDAILTAKGFGNKYIAKMYSEDFENLLKNNE